jgi:hypothetical protein
MSGENILGSFPLFNSCTVEPKPITELNSVCKPNNNTRHLIVSLPTVDFIELVWIMFDSETVEMSCLMKRLDVLYTIELNFSMGKNH